MHTGILFVFWGRGLANQSARGPRVQNQYDISLMVGWLTVADELSWLGCLILIVAMRRWPMPRTKLEDGTPNAKKSAQRK
jgi:hypothetical protein